ncbi:hydroxymethylglutaryl-CoA reductase [Thaumasiovibrio subtropicus]|uniref:hydroxymethylglutaryl-CoA reductase n=1 Tax=Thaumasiovibrio subtropicus TaxID=1891207 RepID=UPI000B34AFED|nr:hydroxymethylglutaryl-CoA reductase [Thaumasiovibrio subtropicus]
MPKLNFQQKSFEHAKLGNLCSDAISEKLSRPETPLRAVQTRNPYISPKQVSKRWNVLDNEDAKRQLFDSKTEQDMDAYQKNIENFIGTAKMPIGLVGPMRVNGLFANDDFYLPLATTEAALVASYNRGAQLISEAGGASAMLVSEAVLRTPGFCFDTLAQAGQFVAWAVTRYDDFKAVAQKTTRHGKLIDISVNIEANNVYLIFEFTTGDASGQNMVTIATNEVYNYILDHSPITPKYAYVEANLSGDKKATAQSLRNVRGKKVSVEIIIPAELVKKRLHTSVDSMVNYCRLSATGGVLSGSIGVHGHYANGLAALYIACGQDAACVAESAVGITRLEKTDEGALYASVTMPNLMVGTVGGGTSLPSQKACLDIVGLAGEGNAKALAEVTATLCLAGELSIIGALSAGHFSRAHHKLARHK